MVSSNVDYSLKGLTDFQKEAPVKIRTYEKCTFQEWREKCYLTFYSTGLFFYWNQSQEGIRPNIL